MSQVFAEYVAVISVEQFLHGLRGAGVVPDQLVEELRQSAGGQTVFQLADRLVGQGLITAYQREEMLEGRGGRLSLGGYLLLDRIGEGGMGQVYLALHRQMERRVAIKVLPPHAADSADAVERFRREIRIVARLSNPNIVAAFDAGEDNGMQYLAMEYVEGETLHALVRRRGPLPVDEALDYLAQAARGLKAAHAAGIVHRDVKPANLLCDRAGVVKIFDLGLARLTFPARELAGAGRVDSLTRTDQILGTIDYMAPEQAATGRDVDRRADVYSLGCCLHFLLTSRTVYDRASLVDCLLAHRDAEIPSLRQARPDVPEWLDAAFCRMVAKRPEDRFGSMDELLDALGATAAPAAGETRRGGAEPSLGAIAPFVPPVTPPSSSARSAPGKRRRLRRPPAVAVAFAAVVLLGTLALVAHRLGWFGGASVSQQTGGITGGEPVDTTPLVAAKPVLALRGHTNTIECLAYIPGGNRVISGDDDQRILVWDLAGGRQQFQLALGDDSGPCLAVSPDGALAATAGDNEVLKVWDLSSKKEIKRLSGHHVAFSPAGKLLAAALVDDHLALYDTADWQGAGALVGHTDSVQAMAFTADGKTLASGDVLGILRIWDIAGRSERFALENGSRIHEVVLSPKGEFAAAACDDGAVRLWNLAQRQLRWNVAAHRGKALRLALSPDQTRLASSGGDGTIALWNVSSGRLRTRWQAHRGESVAMAFSPDGKRLISGGDDQLVKTWDVDALLAATPPDAAP